MKDLTLLDKIIVGRVEPHIYAFETNTFPNYLKIGDTYRPVNVRLNEWKKHYPDLKKKFECKSMVDDDTFFRDYSVHQYIENELKKERLKESNVKGNNYYSNEFFKEATVIDVQKAIDDIQRDFDNNLMKYQYYNASDNLRVITEYASTGFWHLRPNQEQVVKNFKKALDKGRTNLLLYAVMRFGKSFTAMCCALEMKANTVLIVSAKADVKDEWQKTIQSADNFNDYVFIDSDRLASDSKIIKTNLSQNRKVAIFLTLQDLQGDEIKDKHKELFQTGVDLLLIDETHYGARAEKYGAILRETKDVEDKREDYFVDYIEADKIVKKLNSKVRIHLSGTPYRILMSSEFESDDIIAFYQFTDIVKEQEEWDKEHILDDNYKEWDNPYYGFPQMIRFAFNPSKSIRDKINEFRKNGITYAFSELFKPLSITKDSDDKHKLFKHEKEILELFEIIDGSKTDDEILGFLDYDKIKKGNMCRHMVIVLPFCASCDALEKLISDNVDKFKNLKDYEIINISGVDKTNIYRSVNDVKNKITEFENDNKKTITLTVNRMLTGSTVEEWDTMIYLKDTSSPQEYDQAIFRLQNHYVKDYVSSSGDLIKYNKKPQTLLVDFQPNRIYLMQETKSLIYNVNVDKSGNSKLSERLEEELRVSPIITINKNKIVEITPIDIMKYVSNYSNSRSVLDESNDIPVDMKLMTIDKIKNIILQQPELGTKSGLKLFNTDDEPDDEFEFEEQTLNLDSEDENSNQNENNHNSEEQVKNDLTKIIVNKFKTYYARILFYSFLSDSSLNSLESIINSSDDENNNRILNNLGLNIEILKIIFKNIDPFILSQLDYKIQNINDLSKDDTLSEIERSFVAIRKFNKLSEAEIITPQNICDEIYNSINLNKIRDCIDNDGIILDIASKEGEFALSLFRLMNGKVNLEKLKNCIYSIPTSSVAYEFTRKIYKILGFNINNIASCFNVYDLINWLETNNFNFSALNELICQDKEFSAIELDNNLFFKKGVENMKFSYIVGNPPYQANIENRGEQPPLYHIFYDYASNLSDVVTLITPARFLFDAGKTPSEWNKKMLNNPHFKVIHYIPDSNDVFDNVELKGGVAITCINNNENYGAIEEFIQDPVLRTILDKVKDNSNRFISDIIYSNTSYKYSNLFFTENEGFDKRVSGGSSRYLSSSVFDKFPEVFYDNKPDNSKYALIIGRKNNQRVTKYFAEKYLVPPENYNNYKIYLASSNGAGVLGEPLSEPILGEPGIGATETFVSFGNFKTKDEAINLEKYFKTKFARLMLGTKKVTPGNKKASVWSNVPLQDFTNNSDINWNKKINEIDTQLYSKYQLTKNEIEYVESKVQKMD